MRFLTRSLLGMSLLALTVALLLLAGNTLFATFQEQAENQRGQRPQRERVFTVTVQPIELQSLRPIISAFGEVVSGRTLEIRTASGGALVQLSPAFREGGAVRKGDILFQTDPAAAEASLSIAKTELAEANAELTEAKEALILSRDELTAASRQVDLRQTALERQQSLLRRRVGTEAAVETAALSLSSAEQSVLTKRQAVANAKARITRAEIAVSRRQINFDEATRQVQELTVRAEFDGVLTDVSAVLGGLVNPNEKLGQLIDPDGLEVAFRISNAQYANLVKRADGIENAEVFIDFSVFEDPVKARLDRVGASVGAGQTGRELFAKIDQVNAVTLRPGDFVEVSLQEPALQNVSLIPASAATAQGDVLLLGEDDRLEEVQVDILRKQGDDLIVSARDFAGRSLVKQRAPQLGAGIKVKPREDAPAVLQAQEMVKIAPAEAERLSAAIDKSRMPDDVKARVKARLASGEMPKDGYDRVQRMAARFGGDASAGPSEMVKLQPDEVQKFRQFLATNNQMPDRAKTRILAALEAGEMPKDMYDRLSQRVKG